MGRVVLSASMSLDGFSAGPGVGLDQPMGRGGERLHEWLFDDGDDGKPDAQIARERVEATGAVVVGRRTFDVGIEPWGDVPFPVPCFVLTLRAHARGPRRDGDAERNVHVRARRDRAYAPARADSGR
jgi:dihydrofolate reductase